MKRFLIGLLIILSCSAASKAQQYELVCPTGSISVPFLESADRATGKFRQNYCIDSVTGAITQNQGGGIQANSPTPPASSLIPGFNVRNYGALGDTQRVNSPTVTAPGGNDITCAQCNFTQADVGKTLFVNSNLGQFGIPQTTITKVVSSTRVTLASLSIGPGAFSVIVWGHIDDSAFAVVSSLLNLAIVYQGSQGGGNLGVITTSPEAYMPAGNYLLCNQPNGAFLINTSNLAGYSIFGDASNQTTISLCQTPTLPANSIFFNRVFNTSSATVHGFTVNGNFSPVGAVAAVGMGAGIYKDIIVTNWGPGGTTCSPTPAGIQVGSSVAIYNSGVTASCSGMTITGTNIDIYTPLNSNNAGFNMQITNSFGGGAGGGGSGVRIHQGTDDECANADPATFSSCIAVINSQDVYFTELGMFSANGSNPSFALAVDGTSVAHIVSGVLGQFSGGGGAKVLPGGMLQATDTRFFGTATGPCIDLTAVNGVSGIFKDLGGNTCTVDSIIAASPGGLTESGNTVTLTTSIAHGLPVGSSGQLIWVRAAGVTGYNGTFIVASVPSTTTLTYKNANSGLANSGGGNVDINQALTGQKVGGPFLSALTHGTINYFIPTDTAQTWASWPPDQPINITRITVQSSNTPACTVAPQFRLSNGITTQNLNLSLSNAFTDSGIITALFDPGAQIVISLSAAGTCTTAPVNLNVTINWQANGQP